MRASLSASRRSTRRLERAVSEDVVATLALTADAARDVLAMGPNAHHVAADDLASLGARETTLAVRVESLVAPRR
ncbi:hypothetical protein GCM10025876_15220 [Demequina litorisediminis]|uniref:Uncharacterized protein n=1 Tax=Demequina litorisediminis TaxID=1849022 RepID=A0ABQ6IBV4_9MICO|nr:hypothetical protein GCM10025876_15220 [Demequina litorisediminis]